MKRTKRIATRLKRLLRRRSSRAGKGGIDPPFCELLEWIPAEQLIVDAGELSVYECDALPLYRQAPDAVVLCRGREDVKRVIRWCHRRKVPWVPRGAGTGLSGGATPTPGCVVVETCRMRRIIHIDIENRYAVVEPGVVNSKLTEATLPYGLHFAPDPSSQQSCTIGGNVGENAGGPHCLKYGVTTDHVLGLEVVLPDGNTVRLGGPHALSQGYDLVGLFTGTEGTFGVVTEITVRLLPLPAGVRTYLAIFESMHLATRTVADITLAGILPVALEILDRRAIRALEASVFAAGYPEGAAAVLLIELDGIEAGMDQEEETIKALVLRNRALEFRTARDEAEREKLWRGRKGAYGAMGRIQPDLHILDGVVPRTRLEATVEAFDRVAEEHGLELTNVFHAGDGNVHPSISYDGRDANQARGVLAASRDICRICVEAGGTLSGEHGIGLEKKEFLPMLYGAGELELLQQLKRVVDPEGLANPGKIFPAPGAETPRSREPDPGSAR